MGNAKWVLDGSHSLFEFAVKHMMIATVKGRFTGVQGVIYADPANLTAAQFSATAEVATIDTRDEQRDGHLRSADFFEAEKYPTITFQSKKISPKGDEYELVGDLTIKGVTREITLTLTYEGSGKDPWGNEKIGFSAEGKINRKDFGLTWNVALETGGILVGEDVRLSIQIEAAKQA